MAKDKPNKIVSKKHLARQERERRQTKAITYTAIGIITIIILLIGYGILNETYLAGQKTILTVNGEKVTTREFYVRIRATRKWYIDQYLQIIQFAQAMGIDPTTDQSASDQLGQIESQLSMPAMIGGQVLNEIEDDLLIKQFAKANGITVTKEDVEQAIQNDFSFYPDGTPTPGPTSTSLVYSTLSAAQNALVTPTLTLTPAPTRTPRPTSTPDLTATAMPTSENTPTVTPYTLDGFKKAYQDSLDYYHTLGMNEADFRQIYFENRLYRERVTAMVTADVPHEQDQVWARQILVADEATAQDIRAQLLAGADFAALAAQDSLDTTSQQAGGDLGWFGPGKMAAEFETAAYGLDIGVISQPVQSSSGWHIIQVLGHEVRPLTDTEYQDAVKAAFDKWLQTQRDGADVVITEGWTANVPNKPDLQETLTKYYATQSAMAATYQAMLTTQP
jgi:peptidyl-prolyl cis-trans isomerase D